MTLNNLFCSDVPLSNYSLAHYCTVRMLATRGDETIISHLHVC